MTEEYQGSSGFIVQRRDLDTRDITKGHRAGANEYRSLIPRAKLSADRAQNDGNVWTGVRRLNAERRIRVGGGIASGAAPTPVACRLAVVGA